MSTSVTQSVFPYMGSSHHQFSPEGCGNPTGVCQQAGRRGLTPIFPVCFLALIPADKILCYPKPAQAGAEQQHRPYSEVAQEECWTKALHPSSKSGQQTAELLRGDEAILFFPIQMNEIPVNRYWANFPTLDDLPRPIFASGRPIKAALDEIYVAGCVHSDHHRGIFDVAQYSSNVGDWLDVCSTNMFSQIVKQLIINFAPHSSIESLIKQTFKAIYRFFHLCGNHSDVMHHQIAASIFQIVFFAPIQIIQATYSYHCSQNRHHAGDQCLPVVYDCEPSSHRHCCQLPHNETNRYSQRQSCKDFYLRHKFQPSFGDAR